MQTNTQVENAPRVRPDKVLRAKDRMSSDFNALVVDAEDLLRSTATYTGESVNAARVKFQDSLDKFKERVSDAQGAATAKWNRAAAATDGYLHDNPWKVVGVAAVVGLVLGSLLHKK
jgi:ElaB/YqjD/DUF883 family membrane-anchored ribosome-binding protein